METSLSNKSYEMAPEVKKAWVAIALLIIIEIAAASFGYDGRKIFQITALLTPTLLLLLVPIKSNHINLIRQVFVWIIFLIFILDSIVRIHLFSNYDAAPDSSMIVGAVANTNKEEVREYIFSQSRYFWASLSIFLIIALFSFKITQQGIRNKHRSSKIHKFILILAICISMVAYASKPWRRINPFIFWSQFVESAIETKESWRTYDQARKDALELAKGKNPEVERMGSSTIVLVISESINRDNMSLYGYERQTTRQTTAPKPEPPRLRALRRRIKGTCLQYTRPQKRSQALPAKRSQAPPAGRSLAPFCRKSLAPFLMRIDLHGEDNYNPTHQVITNAKIS